MGNASQNSRLYRSGVFTSGKYMKETRVLFISLLKPCNDVRWQDRMAPAFQAFLPQAILYSAGPYAAGSIADCWEACVGLFEYNRKACNRIANMWKLMLFSLKVKPSIIVANCSELLYVAIVNKILFGSKIVYDVQENFALNVRQSHTQILPVRLLIALFVQLTERISAPFVLRYWLAEHVYLKQMPSKSKKACALENIPFYSVYFPAHTLAHPIKRIVLTGTISKRFGVYTALEWGKQLNALHAACTLDLVGHCPDPVLEAELKEIAMRTPWIRLNISQSPIPNACIREAISTADAVLLPYTKAVEIEGKIPSKLWEAVVLGIPCLLPLHMSNTIPMVPFYGCLNAGLSKLSQEDCIAKQKIWRKTFEDEIQFLV